MEDPLAMSDRPAPANPFRDGYKRSPQTTAALVAALTVALYANPEQRLGQLLINHGNNKDLWNVRDEDWIRSLGGSNMEETQRIRRGHDFLPPPSVREKVPALYATEDVDAADKTVWLHYFGGSYDAWIVEADFDTGEAFGFVRIAGLGDGEWGYVDLTEAEAVNTGLVIIERDKWWEPKPFSEVAL